MYLDASGNPAISNSVQVDTIWQFEWNSSTHVVSAKALYAGVSILFDGDDYADQLTSAARNKSFTKVADRLEEIEQLLAEMSGFYAEDPDNHDGLDFYYLAGKVRNDSVIYDTVAGHVTLADDDTNYVEVDPADGTVSANGTGFTSGQIALFQVVTASGAITNVTDVRTWALAGTGGGGGGGHTQNTDLGTTSPTFTLNTMRLGPRLRTANWRWSGAMKPMSPSSGTKLRTSGNTPTTAPTGTTSATSPLPLAPRS